MQATSFDISEANEDTDVEMDKEPASSYNRKVSTLDSHADPFAPRDGKTLVWKDVNMTLVS